MKYPCLTWVTWGKPHILPEREGGQWKRKKEKHQRRLSLTCFTSLRLATHALTPTLPSCCSYLFIYLFRKLLCLLSRECALYVAIRLTLWLHGILTSYIKHKCDCVVTGFGCNWQHVLSSLSLSDLWKRHWNNMPVRQETKLPLQKVHAKEREAVQHGNQSESKQNLWSALD